MGLSTSILEIQETRTYEWSVNRVSDRYDNRILYTYEGGASEKRIKNIDYNFVQGAPQNSVQFTYESRPDSSSGFFAGAPVVQNQRLRKMASFAGTKELRSLILEYTNNTATYDSVVSKVWECAGGSESTCTLPTQFSWENGAAGLSTTPNNSGNSAAGWDNNPLAMDVNGDGRADLVQADGGKWRIMLSNGEKYATQIASTISDTGWETAKVIRYNSDKYDDILLAKNGRWYVLLGGATASQVINVTYGGQTFPVTIPSSPTLTEVDTGIVVNQATTDSAQLIDINGDSLKDMIYSSGTGWFEGVRVRLATYNEQTGNIQFGSALNTGLANDINFSKSFIFDINGDGREDVLAAPQNTTGGRWDLLLSKGTSFDRLELDEQNTTYENTDNIRVMDFNGDGLQDILIKTSGNSIAVRLNTGSGFASESTVLSNYSIGNTEWKLALNYDYNGDGRDDLLFRNGNYWYALVSNGVTFTSVFTGISNTGWDRSPIVSDMTGNGMPDLTLNINNTWQTLPHNSVRPDYLLKVTNGMGVETEFDYRFLTDPTDPNFYDRGSDVNYPVVSVQNASYLVSEVRQSDGWASTFAGMNSTSYRYKKLLIHQRGLGNLGFEEIINKNNDTGIETVSTFSQDYENRTHGSLLHVKTTASNGSVLSDTTNTWQLATLCGAGKGTTCTDDSDPSRRYLLSPATTTVVKRDLNGAFLHQEVSTNPSVKDIYYGDDFGGANDARTMTSIVKNEAGSTLRTKTTVMRYDNDVSNWLMGMVRQSEVVSDINDGSPITRISEFDYDSNTGRKTEERILDPSNNTVLHRTRYGINASGGSAVDSYGRNLAVTVSGPDFEPRTSSVAYDSSQRYIASETNALSQTVSHTYYGDTSVNAGLRLESIDPNGLRTLFTYDSFGRPLTTTAFYGTAKPVTTTSSYHNCVQSSDRCPTVANGYARYYVKNIGADGSQTRTYFNILGNTVRKATLGFKESSEEWVFQDTVYDRRGNPTYSSEPFYEGSGSTPWNQAAYDALDRPYIALSADGRYDYIVYNGLQVSSIRDYTQKNQVKIEQRDSLGNLIKVTDTTGQFVTYTYNALGQMLSTQPPGVSGLVVGPTTVSYDVLGRKTAMNDPDKGTWSYTYNGLGELISQTNARGETGCMAYDKLGRMVKRIDDYAGTVSTNPGQVSQSTQSCAGDSSNPNTASWVYDTASGAGIGALHQVAGTNGYQKTLTYDAYGAASQVLETINGSSYSTQSTYDNLHRLDVVTYPGPSNRLQVRSTYNPRGFLKSLTNVQSNEVYFLTETMDARGNITQELYANGLRTYRAYERETGYILAMGSGTSLDPLGHQSMVFDFDAVGNLLSRTDNVHSISETFDYDNLNRLTHTYADFGNSQVQETTVGYDALGNIISKTGVGTYKYGSQCAGNTSGPHAVCNITGGSVGTKNATYSYDANGNMLSGDGRNITWGLFDKPTQISQGGNTTVMSYGPERQLLTRADTTSAGTTNTVFVGGLYEKVTDQNNNVKERHYVGGHTIVTYNNRTASTAGTKDTRYLIKDHIGSVIGITNESGTVLETFSFDPWGKRRAPTLADLEAKLGSWNTLNTYQKGNLTISAMLLGSDITNKGFTGHEQLDQVNLIHMGGRVYDAEIGRFLSADPFVQDSTNIQALNRYSYVQNNPLSYTDPSGYFLSGLLDGLKDLASGIWKAHKQVLNAFLNVHKKILRKIGENQILSTAISIGLGIACGGAAAQCVMAFNAAMTAANGGTIKHVLTGAAIGYVAGGLTSRLGGFFAGQGATAGRVFASNTGAAMIVGGAVAKAQGGKFIDGVKGAAVGAAIGYGIKRIMNAVTPPAEAVTVSESNGGQLDSKTYTEEQWELARQNVSQARDMVVADIRSGDLDIGLVEDQVLGGFDKGIKLKVVASIDGANADVTFSPDQSIAGRAMGRVMDVKINIAVGRAQTLGGAIESYTHELRHLSPANRAMSGPAPGVSVYYGEQESDARRTGGAVRRSYGY